MLDDLRNSSAFIDDEEPQDSVSEQSMPQRRPTRKHQKATFLGLTAQQRFIISLMLFFMVCLLGAFALVVSGSVVLPF